MFSVDCCLVASAALAHMFNQSRLCLAFNKAIKWSSEGDCFSNAAEAWTLNLSFKTNMDKKNHSSAKNLNIYTSMQTCDMTESSGGATKWTLWVFFWWNMSQSTFLSEKMWIFWMPLSSISQWMFAWYFYEHFLGELPAVRDHVIWLKAPQQLLNGPCGETFFLNCCFQGQK